MKADNPVGQDSRHSPGSFTKVRSPEGDRVGRVRVDTPLGRSLKVELERAVMTLRFAVSILLPCLFYLASGADELFQLWHSSHVDVLHFADFLGNVGSFSMMLILAACFPCATAYCDDLRHQYLRCQLLRYKTSIYCAAKIITAALVEAVASAGGLLLFILLLGLRFPFTLPGSGLYDSAVMAQATHYWGRYWQRAAGPPTLAGCSCAAAYMAHYGERRASPFPA